MYKRALVSVFDKSGLEGFLRPLADQGLEIFSTGGTSLFLKSKGFQVADVKELTSFPELLSGRVKTLHPHIYMALLARHWEKSDQEVLEQRGIRPFDLLVGNLYPFEKEGAGREGRELAEWIDVGGPGFLRAGAKNYFSVTVVCDPEDYKEAQKGTNLQQRKKLAVKVFKKLAQYDQFIAQRLNGEAVAGSDFTRKGDFFKDIYRKTKKNQFDFVRKGRFFKRLSYGENPHQRADWHTTEARGLHEAEIIQGKALSYNNILDFSATVSAVRDFSMPCALAVKHNSPCGAGWADSLSVAVKKVLQADPLSIFGGIMALNRAMDESSAELIEGLFLEGLIAPDFSASALNRLKRKKNLRLLKWPDMLTVSLPVNSAREVIGGFLEQTRDQIRREWPQNWKIIGEEPPETVKKDLLFAWILCAHLKSNAIAVVKNLQSLGLGMGEVSRVAAVRSALGRVKEFHGSETNNLVLASDGFFPFPDSIELAFQGGIKWIIQPGGSIRDKEVIKKAQNLGLSMVLTGERHFKH